MRLTVKDKQKATVPQKVKNKSNVDFQIHSGANFGHPSINL